MNKITMILGAVFLIGQSFNQFAFFNLIFVNTDWGQNGLGAGAAWITITLVGFISYMCGAFIASAQHYKSLVARWAFTLLISSFFVLMLTMERMYGNIVEDQGVGSPHLMPIMYISLALSLWLLLQITRQRV